MIVDDGVASRENRDNVLNVNFNDTGIFSGYHDSLGHVTCIAFADNYTKDINESLIVLNET
jgi:hypothetical protein